MKVLPLSIWKGDLSDGQSGLLQNDRYSENELLTKKIPDITPPGFIPIYQDIIVNQEPGIKEIAIERKDGSMFKCVYFRFCTGNKQ